MDGSGVRKEVRDGRQLTTIVIMNRVMGETIYIHTDNPWTHGLTHANCGNCIIVVELASSPHFGAYLVMGMYE